MSKENTLFQLFEKSSFPLKNKVVMAPMTRSRATQDHVPTDIMATYYQQRAASAGLIITEGTAPSLNGVGYPRIPGIYNPAQTDAWKKVTDAVHEKGSKIFVQLMHTGRVSHPDNMPPEAVVMAPSAIPPADTKMHVDGKGELEIPTPKEMTLREIEHVVEEFVQAAKNAMEAGFDGVEIHSANGYLLEQFINKNTNLREDSYGGSTKGRTRLTLKVVDAVIKAIGADHVGIRLSPNGQLNDVGPFDGQGETYEYLTRQLNDLGLLYIHLVNHEDMGAPALPDDLRNFIRDVFDGILILSGGYDDESAEKDLQDNKGDLIAFGRPLIANPDLVYRWKNNKDLNDPKPDLFYTPGPEGYIDYETA
jgi:N-ethylmaleimide reductase